MFPFSFIGGGISISPNNPLLDVFYDALVNDLETSKVRVVALGDSITGRYNATLPLTEGYDVLLRDKYSSKFGISQTGDGFYPLYKRLTGVTTEIDSYWTLSNNGIAVGGEPRGPHNCQRFIENRNTCTITVNGRYFTFFHLKSVFGTNLSGSRSYYSVDGGANVEFDSYSATYTQAQEVVDMGTNGSHTIVFTAPIIGKYFCPWGVEVTTKQTGLVFWNAGLSGADIAGFASGDANGWISAAKPKLVIMPCNTNDAAGGTSAASFETSLNAIADQVNLNGNLYIVGENLRSGADVYQQGTLYPKQQSVATAKSCALINIPDFAGWTTLAIQNSSGNCTDGVHPTTQGMAGYSDIIFSQLPY